MSGAAPVRKDCGQGLGAGAGPERRLLYWSAPAQAGSQRAPGGDGGKAVR